MGWRVLTYRLAADGSKHRVSVWRELRRVGAVALQSATWAIPTGDGFDTGLAKAVGLVQRAGGQVVVLDVDPASEDVVELERLYNLDRDAEWTEFCAECEKASDELAREVAQKKFTLAELDEEEHNVERLRRWYRELRAKDLFGAEAASLADTRLKECTEQLEDFAERVYHARQHP